MKKFFVAAVAVVALSLAACSVKTQPSDFNSPSQVYKGAS